jgi:hypothetical protein
MVLCSVGETKCSYYLFDISIFLLSGIKIKLQQMTNYNMEPNKEKRSTPSV